jgi:hypothetical protein
MADRSSKEKNDSTSDNNGDESQPLKSLSRTDSLGPMNMPDGGPMTLQDNTNDEQQQSDEVEKAQSSKPAATSAGAVAYRDGLHGERAANRKLNQLQEETSASLPGATNVPHQRPSGKKGAQYSAEEINSDEGINRSVATSNASANGSSVGHSTGGSAYPTFRQSRLQSSSEDEDEEFFSSDEETAPGARRVSVEPVSESVGNAQRVIPRGISAKVVSNDETLNAAELREKVRREAQQEVERRIIDTTVYGEATIIREEDEEEDDSGNRKWYIAVAVAVTVIIVVTLSVALTGSDDPDPIQSVNSICSSAFGPLANFTGGTTEGNIQPQADVDIVTCQVGADDGFGLWYYLDGTGNRLSASTCIGSDSEPQTDTQVLVFSGSCDDLICIGGGDQLCGAHSAVGWLAEQGVRYYILVRGFRASLGRFTLTIDELSDNEKCDSATVIDTVESPVFGSSRNLTLNDSIEACNGTMAVAPGSWYRVEGDGSYKCTYSNSDDPSSLKYQLQLFLYSGSCTDPTCVASATGQDVASTHRTAHVVWKAESNVDYFLHVHGVELNSVGDFLVHLLSPPSNVICDEALVIQVGGIAESGTTIDSCRVVPTECPRVLEAGDSSGVWYVVNGTSSNLLTAYADFEVETNCKSTRGASAQVSVFRGSTYGCSKLDCVDFIDFCDPGSKATASQWLSDPGETYYLFVQVSENSPFTLKLEESTLQVPDRCEDSVGTSIASSVLGSTMNATADDLGECSTISAETPTVFFMVNGTGSDITASTCNEGTNFATGITIVTGDCENFGCVESTVVTCDGIRSIASWPSASGQTYYVAVHGMTNAEPDSGRFNLTLSNRGIDVENDFCNTADEVLIPSATNGSTANATLNDNQRCGGNRSNPKSPGIWYSVLGQGSLLIASLCNDGTDFDTLIQVFSGSCDSLVCVASNDDFDSDFCDKKSLVSWNATQDERYYILVTGFAATDVGSVVLNITLEE